MSQDPMGFLLGVALNWQDENRRQLKSNYIQCHIETHGKCIVATLTSDPLGNRPTRSETLRWRGPLLQYPDGLNLYQTLSDFMNQFTRGLRRGTIEVKDQQGPGLPAGPVTEVAG